MDYEQFGPAAPKLAKKAFGPMLLFAFFPAFLGSFLPSFLLSVMFTLKLENFSPQFLLMSAKGNQENILPVIGSEYSLVFYNFEIFSFYWFLFSLLIWIVIYFLALRKKPEIKYMKIGRLIGGFAISSVFFFYIFIFDNFYQVSGGAVSRYVRPLSGIFFYSFSVFAISQLYSWVFVAGTLRYLARK